MPRRRSRVVAGRCSPGLDTSSMADCEWYGPYRSVILTSLLLSAPYLSPSHVAIDATRQSARNADYQHLQEPDPLWTGAILSDRAQKDHQSRPLRDRDFLLDSTIEVGLYDNKAANTFLEKSMRYTAVNSSLLYDHIVTLENKVIRQLASVLS